MERQVEHLASFITKARYEDLSEPTIQALKIRILDSLGCAIGAIGSPVIEMLKKQVDDFGGRPLCSIIGGGKSAPDRAAFYNGALIRYLDFNDSFLAKNETCHPSDNIAPVLASCEYAEADGKELLLAVAVAYQVHCRLSEEAPVRKKGFDHTTQGSYAVASGVAKALRLSPSQTANAIAMAAVANNALRVTRTGVLSHWKGLAYPNTAFSSTHAVFLASRGVTGPLEIFEGNKGFMEAISGPFFIDWEKEHLNAVHKTIIKKYNAEIHSQPALEGILELRNQISVHDVERIELTVFDVAYHIIGGGEEGGKKEIRTKEEADHSLPYMVAVALIDGKVTPEQYEPHRIVREDVQNLLRRIDVHPSDEFSRRFPNEMPTSVRVIKKNGSVVQKEKTDYEGFFTRPMSWEQAISKFKHLAFGHADDDLCDEIIEVVKTIEIRRVQDLAKLLQSVE